VSAPARIARTNSLSLVGLAMALETMSSVDNGTASFSASRPAIVTEYGIFCGIKPMALPPALCEPKR